MNKPLNIVNQRFMGVSWYAFGFNGMERDDDIQGSGNALDFGARIYDANKLAI